MNSTETILRAKLRPAANVAGQEAQWWADHIDATLRDVCKSALGLDVALSEIGAQRLRVDAALNAMEPVTLPFLLATEAGKRGLITIDGTLIDGLIEQQMLGQVQKLPRLDRPITAIDAGLSEVFIRAALAGLSEAAGSLSALTTLGPEQDRAALRLALGEGQVDLLQVRIDMGPGIKSGLCTIWLPAAAMRKAAPRSVVDPAMAAIVKGCPVALEAQIAPVKVTGAELAQVKPGYLLPLPASAINTIDLLDCSGRLLASARLGQLNGYRAVRVAQLPGRGEGIAGPEAQPEIPALTEQAQVPPPTPEAEEQLQEVPPDLAQAQSA